MLSPWERCVMPESNNNNLEITESNSIEINETSNVDIELKDGDGGALKLPFGLAAKVAQGAVAAAGAVVSVADQAARLAQEGLGNDKSSESECLSSRC